MLPEAPLNNGDALIAGLAAGMDCELLITILDWGKGHMPNIKMRGTLLRKTPGFLSPNPAELACRVPVNRNKNVTFLDIVILGDRARRRAL